MCMRACVCVCTHHEISIRIIYTCHLGCFLFNMKRRRRRRRRQTKLRVFHLCESEGFYRWYHIILCLYFALLWLLFYLLSLVDCWPGRFSPSTFDFQRFAFAPYCDSKTQQQKQWQNHTNININGNKTFTAFFEIFHQATRIHESFARYFRFGF